MIKLINIIAEICPTSSTERLKNSFIATTLLSIATACVFKARAKSTSLVVVAKTASVSNVNSIMFAGEGQTLPAGKTSHAYKVTRATYLSSYAVNILSLTRKPFN